MASIGDTPLVGLLRDLKTALDSGLLTQEMYTQEVRQAMSEARAAVVAPRPATANTTRTRTSGSKSKSSKSSKSRSRSRSRSRARPGSATSDSVRRLANIVRMETELTSDAKASNGDMTIKFKTSTPYDADIKSVCLESKTATVETLCNHVLAAADLKERFDEGKITVDLYWSTGHILAIDGGRSQETPFRETLMTDLGFQKTRHPAQQGELKADDMVVETSASVAAAAAAGPERDPAPQRSRRRSPRTRARKRKASNAASDVDAAEAADDAGPSTALSRESSGSKRRRKEQSGNELVYVVIRTPFTKLTIPRSFGANFLFPGSSYVESTNRGTSYFLGALYSVADHMKRADRLRFLGRVLRYTNFQPLIFALERLLERTVVHPVYNAMVFNCMHSLFREIVPRSVANNADVFEYSAECFHFLTRNLVDADAKDVLPPTVYSITCPLTHVRVDDPVTIEHIAGKYIYSRAAVDKAIEDTGKVSGHEVKREQLVEVPDVACYVRTTPTVNSNIWDSIVLWKVPTSAEIENRIAEKPQVGYWSLLVREAAGNFRVCLTPTLQLKAAGIATPLLTLDKDRNILVFRGPVACSHESDLFSPLSGQQQQSLDDLAVQTNAYFSGDHADAPTADPEEALLVLLDISMSMHNMFETMSRLATVKQLFNALANRAMAYNFAMHIGLTLFGDECKESCGLTPLFERFKGRLDQVEQEGRTALYDAVIHGATQLEKYKEKYPNCRRRILVLSDGEDTSSQSLPWQAANKLRGLDITLDAIIIGNECDPYLKSLTHATGGVTLHPTSVHDGFKLFEYETVLRASDRVESKIDTSARISSNSMLHRSYHPRDHGYDSPPARRLPVALADEKKIKSISLTKAMQVARMQLRDKHRGAASANSFNIKRICKELAHAMRKPHKDIRVLPMEDHIDFWRVLMRGPEATPYEGATFSLYVHFGPNYPEKPPEVRFVTPVMHCNVNGTGRVCHPVFGRDYSSSMRVLFLLENVYGLLMYPEPKDPVDSVLAELFLAQRSQYNSKVRAHTTANAKSKTFEAWVAELSEEVDDGKDSDESASAMAAAADDMEPPDHLVCPITLEVFVDPVCTIYGHCYERDAILQVLSRTNNDPFTNQPLTRANLNPIFSIKAAAEEWRKTHPDY
jgi:ubiquitin-protein ligase